MDTKYGRYSPSQLRDIKAYIRKSIFFLLLYVDPVTKAEYLNVDVDEAFDNLQYTLSGLNSILLEPPELVRVMSLIEEAHTEYKKGEEFGFPKYRKLILDAGADIMRLKVGDDHEP